MGTQHCSQSQLFHILRPVQISGQWNEPALLPDLLGQARGLPLDRRNDSLKLRGKEVASHILF